MSSRVCRFCAAPLSYTFADLGVAPLSNAFLEEADLSRMEPFYPLHAFVCESCFLVQLDEFEAPERLFSEYAYFSSFSTTWLEHCRLFVEDVCERLSLGPSSRVVEIASNDGYLLQYFRERGLEVLGIEPAENVAKTAVSRGIPTLTRFFGAELASELAPAHAADLLVANNVLAHVPNLNDFVGGLDVLLAAGGTVTLEFPHLLRLVEEVQFDTIYHEHFSYFSFRTAERIFEAHGLAVYDVEEVSTHGGSLRIYARHAEAAPERSARAAGLAERERAAGLEDVATFLRFGDRVEELRREILAFFVEAKKKGATIVGYGAPAKGNTLLNYCGVRTDFLDYTVDRNPWKQGRYLPGTHIPVRAPEAVAETRPDYLFILPWNLEGEIIEQMSFIREWGGRFVTPSPAVRIHE